MAAEHRKRRTRTAREMAEQLGVSERSIRNIVAEPRDDYEGRAKAKQERARALRAGGATYKQIAAELGISIGSVSTLLHRTHATASQGVGTEYAGKGPRQYVTGGQWSM